MNDYLFINGTGLFGVDYQITNTSNNLATNIFYSSNLIIKNNINTSNYILQTSNVISNRITNTSNLILNNNIYGSNYTSTRITATSNVISNRITNLILNLSTNNVIEGSNLYYTNDRTCNCIRDIGISINPLNNTLEILNSNQVDNDTIQAGYGNINFCHIWDEKNVNFPYYPTGNKLKATHTKISGVNGRTEVYWHWGDTDLTPDSWMTILPDSYDNGWYDLMEEIVKTNLLAAKDRDTQKITNVLPNSVLKINGSKQIYLNYDSDYLVKSNDANDYLQVKLGNLGAIGANSGIYVNVDNITIGIGTTGTILNEIYVKDDSIGTSKIINNAINTDKLKYSTSFFTYDNTTNKSLIIKDDAIPFQYSSNYANLTNLWSSNNTNNRDLLRGIYSSNYANLTNLWSSNNTNNRDLLRGIYSSNYGNLIGLWSSNMSYNLVYNLLDNKFIHTSNIFDDIITTALIKDKAITTALINDDAITAPKLANLSVHNSNIISGCIELDRFKLKKKDGTGANVSGLQYTNIAGYSEGISLDINTTDFSIDDVTGKLSLKDDPNGVIKTINITTVPGANLVSTLTGIKANSVYNMTFTPQATLNAIEIGEVNTLIGTAIGTYATGQATVDGLQDTAIGALGVLCGLNTLGLVGEALIDAINNGEAKFKVKAPLTYYDDTIGLNYNNNELFIKDGRLQLNDAYGRLIDWSFKEYQNAFGCYLIGDPITGIKDIYGNVTLGEEYASFTNDLYDPVFDGGFPTINCKRDAAATYGNRFNYASTGFTDKTKLTVCFYAKIKPEQENQPAPDEEAIFHTHNSAAEDGSGTNNGINIKFNFDYANDMAFKIYIKFNKLGGGTQEEAIFENWNGLGTNRLLYSYTNARNWSHYAFVITLSNIKLYINGNLYGTRTFSTSYTSFYNDEYHVFTGYNQDYGAGISPSTKQYWNGYLGDIVVINSDLQQSEIQTFTSGNTYTGDKKIFGDRLKYDTNHFKIDTNSNLQLSTNILNDSINTSNWLLTTSNLISNRITNTSNWIDYNNYIDLVIPPTDSNFYSYSYKTSTFLYSNTGQTAYKFDYNINGIEFGLYSARSTGYEIVNKTQYIGETNGYYDGTTNCYYNPSKLHYLYSNITQRRGEWFYYEMKYPILVNTIVITRPASSTNDPRKFDIYGSDDGINWVEIVYMTTSLTYINDVATYNIPKYNTFYKYIGICFTQVYYEGGGSYRINFTGLDISFKVDRRNYLNSILNGSGYISTSNINSLQISTSNLYSYNIYGNNSYSSNFTLGTSNILVNRIRTEEIFTSNYIIGNSNNLINRILLENLYTSNYILTSSNNLVNNIFNTSNWIKTLDTDFNNKFDTRLATKSTNNLAEGTNLYYTTSRVNTDFDTRLATKSTTNLTEGTNLYYTTTRENTDFDIRLNTKTTSQLLEGSNLYYTTTRENIDFDNRLKTKTTSQLNEGSNLYYTTARENTDFDNRLKTKTTSQLSEGSNLYYTTTRENTDFDNRLKTKTTSQLSEGSNLYSQFITSGSSIYYNGGNIGVGKTDPVKKIEIIGTSLFNNTISILDGNGGTLFASNQIFFGYNNTETYRHVIRTRHQSGTTHHQNSIDFYLWKNPQTSYELGSTHMMSITAAGVGIGKTDPTEILEVNGNIKCNTLKVNTLYYNTNEFLTYDTLYNSPYTLGNTTNNTYPCFVSYQLISSIPYAKMIVYYNGNVWIGGTLTQNSDIRIKKNVVSLNSSNSLNNIMNLRPVQYNRVEDDKINIGLIANEVLPIIPEIINKNDYSYYDSINDVKKDVPDCLNMNYVGLIPYLISSIQELNKKIDVLERKVENKKEK